MKAKKLITILAFASITCALTAEQQSDDAALANQLGKGKLYSHWGVVLQVMEEGFLMDDGKPREVGIEATAPWAFLVFEDPKAMESVSLQPGEWVAATVRFENFRNFPMANGAERRLAVFTCFGFEPHGKGYINLRKKVTSSPAAAIPVPSLSVAPPTNSRAREQSPSKTTDREAELPAQSTPTSTASASATPPSASMDVLPRTAYVKPVKCRFPNCGAQGVHGNVVVSFSDGHVQQVTDGGDGTAARVTADGVTIGWTVGTHYEGPNGVRFHNNILVLFRRGSTVARIMADRPIIEEWELRSGGKEVVVQSRPSHGPSSVQLFDVTSGALKQKFLGYEISSSSPDWARPFAEKTAAATTPVQTNQADLDSAEQEPPHTPPPGSREREDILDALRQRFYSGDRVAAHRNAKRVLFKVDFLRVKADWAFTCVARINASEQAIGKPRCSLLHRVGGRWVDQNCFGALRIYELDRPAQKGVDRGGTMMQKIRRIFPNAPKDIFPEENEGEAARGIPKREEPESATVFVPSESRNRIPSNKLRFRAGEDDQVFVQKFLKRKDELNGPSDRKRQDARQTSSEAGEQGQVCVGFVTQKIKGDGKTTEDGLLCDVLDVTGAKDRAVVFLIGYPKYADVVDGDRINVYGVPVGTLSYQTVAGSTATVRKLKYSKGM